MSKINDLVELCDFNIEDEVDVLGVETNFWMVPERFEEKLEALVMNGTLVVYTQAGRIVPKDELFDFVSHQGGNGLCDNFYSAASLKEVLASIIPECMTLKSKPLLNASLVEKPAIYTQQRVLVPA